ncbi:unnamed protein product [Nyctereutes procyonoides]|uniref:protein-tyrosine-phosphatase n=1 Tax=Nyctereutes procyonoides TaxID=34880 RepID=A0A811Y7J5_NYCPR|nr:unnamed protein product [Nyctereutes procyonoides]
MFMCLDNLCQSSIAEAVFRKLVTDQNLPKKTVTFDYILFMDESNLGYLNRKSYT